MNDSMYNKPALAEGTKVVVKEDNETLAFGKITGIQFISPTRVLSYIVELDRPLDDYDYSNLVVSASCVFLAK